MNALNTIAGNMGSDVRRIAEALRRMGRGPDTVLAHITPREAARLKADGGSGTINPNTGLPEFIEYDYFDNPMQQQQQNTQPITERTVELPTFRPQPQVFAQGSMFPSRQDISQRPEPGPAPFSPAPQAPVEMPAFAPAPASAPSARAPFQTDDELRAVAGPQPTQPGMMERFRTFAEQNPAAMRLGGAGANVLLQALLGRRARKQAEAQAGQLREQAAPFRAAQAEAMGRARGGGFTPQQARALQIEQARARQQLGGMGGVGSAAAGILSGQEMRARSQARQQSFDEALRMAGVADQYEQQAMRQMLERDRETANLLAEVIQRELALSQRTQTQPRQ
jgi:hypothetical protein